MRTIAILIFLLSLFSNQAFALD